MTDKRYLLTYNAGYVDMHEVEQCKDQDEAEDFAYDLWREEVESQADYSAELFTKEVAEEYGMVWEEE